MTTERQGVILLHGLCRSARSMKRMEAGLRVAGYEVINVDYPSRTRSIEELSQRVISEALAESRARGWGKVHFVTHSMGGILVRRYFGHHEDTRLGRVVMLGPPNQGSEVVDKIGHWGLFQKLNGPAGNELGTDQESSIHQLGPVNFELGVIAGDRSINWINSLMIPGPDDGKVSVERTRVEGMKRHIVVHASHPFLMKRKDVIEKTVSFISNGEFGPGLFR